MKSNQLLWVVIGFICYTATSIVHIVSGSPIKEVIVSGLYDSNDTVVKLTSDIFRERVFNRNYASLVEFYNSYCGHCRKYAPTWKAIAADLYGWQGVGQIAAIDCSTDENHDLCREFEIMGYPTIRYFGPNFTSNDKNFGKPTEASEPKKVRHDFALEIRNETNPPANWPIFEPIKDHNIHNVFNGFNEKVEYVFLIYTRNDDAANRPTLPIEIILDFHYNYYIVVRHINSEEVARDIGFTKSTNQFGVVNRKFELVELDVLQFDRAEIKSAIELFISKRNLYVINPAWPTELNDSSHGLPDEKIKEIVDHVLAVGGGSVIYQTDLEQALNYSLFHELTQFKELKGERLLALQRYLGILSKYSPLGKNGRDFLKELYDYSIEFGTDNSILGEMLDQKLKQLYQKYSPVFSSSYFTGCQGSERIYRGYTCGLWSLFHFLTIQSSEMETDDPKTEIQTDPLETLQAIYGYVKFFLGCAECSEHFLKMASEDHIWSVPSKDDAVLWLWSAHNKVNNRLKGDTSEDPKFPKIQFPSQEHCPNCRRTPLQLPSSSIIQSSLSSHQQLNGGGGGGGGNAEEWAKTEVLSYLKRIYSPQNLSRYGVENESILPKTVEALRETRLLENVFSDMDMRMGMFLYLFCIVMMVLAVKLFVRRGYRKKMYSHDFTGKF